MTSRAGYWIGGGLMAAAVLGAILWVVLWSKGVANTVEDFQRVAAPGDRVVRLQAKKYVVYFEGTDADLYAPQISLQVTDAQTGEPLDSAPYRTSLTYTYAGHDGSAQRTISPSRAGSYRVRTQTTSEPRTSASRSERRSPRGSCAEWSGRC